MNKAGISKGAGKLFKYLSPVQIIREVVDLGKVWQQEKTNRKVVEANLNVYLKKLDVIEKYVDIVLEQWREERRESFKNLFRTLDHGLKVKDVQIVGIAINGIVELARTLPPKFWEITEDKEFQKILQGKTEIEL